MKDRSAEKSSNHNAPLATIRRVTEFIGSQHTGKGDTPTFRDGLKEVADIACMVTPSQFSEAQRLVKEAARKLIQTHGHVPQAKLPFLLRLGQTFFCYPLDPND